jgi:hypothetical protein
MRGLHIILVFAVTAELCLSAPVDNEVGKADGYDYGDREDDGEDSSFIYQHMVWPDWKTLPKELFGPEYVWDTKGWPRRADKVQGRVEGKNDVSTTLQAQQN